MEHITVHLPHNKNKTILKGVIIMIIQEIVTVHNQQFKHTYSSESKYIQQVETGAIYDEAYDTMKRDFNYIETDTIIQEDVVPQN